MMSNKNIKRRKKFRAICMPGMFLSLFRRTRTEMSSLSLSLTHTPKWQMIRGLPCPCMFMFSFIHVCFKSCQINLRSYICILIGLVYDQKSVVCFVVWSLCVRLLTSDRKRHLLILSGTDLSKLCYPCESPWKTRFGLKNYVGSFICIAPFLDS